MNNRHTKIIELTEEQLFHLAPLFDLGEHDYSEKRRYKNRYAVLGQAFRVGGYGIVGLKLLRRLETRKLHTIEKHGFKYLSIAGNAFLAHEGREAMGISWTTKQELTQAIPTEYTEFIGKVMIERLGLSM